MTLEHVCLILTIDGLVTLVCTPVDGGVRQVVKIVTIVTAVIWTILQFAGSLPVR